MTTRAPLDGFETALLGELRAHVASRRPSPARPGLRRRLAAGAAIGTAIAATAGVLLLRPDPAFAVDAQSDGDVVVTITSLEDADGLEAALREQGVDAEVDYSADPITPPAPGDGSGEQSFDTESSDDERGTTTHREGDAEEPPAAPCGGVPSAQERERSSVAIDQSGDGVTFTLSSDFVDSDAAIRIVTSGDEGAAGIMVQVEQHC
ncbi:hypothetical protein HNR19_001614 [Nocardioides thalensis]|uniref:Uncharacterized protein n=1 Tax=Nocardioides thalensis TaxID=1914755 RepID=A0A853C1P4_9ACTN|nr:hypothetical protein [Nocardioides thalensis]NYJ00916.1 hypothetical protein [Nocardioides thalensis]